MSDDTSVTKRDLPLRSSSDDTRHQPHVIMIKIICSCLLALRLMFEGALHWEYESHTCNASGTHDEGPFRSRVIRRDKASSVADEGRRLPARLT
jgi:hypothetical protein